jgi:hypothetical protein
MHTPVQQQQQCAHVTHAPCRVPCTRAPGHQGTRTRGRDWGCTWRSPACCELWAAGCELLKCEVTSKRACAGSEGSRSRCSSHVSSGLGCEHCHVRSGAPRSVVRWRFALCFITIIHDQRDSITHCRSLLTALTGCWERIFQCTPSRRAAWGGVTHAGECQLQLATRARVHTCRQLLHALLACVAGSAVGVTEPPPPRPGSGSG